MKTELERMLNKATTDYMEILKRVLNSENIAMDIQLNDVPKEALNKLNKEEPITNGQTLRFNNTKIKMQLSHHANDELPF
ncbi:MAG: hypothetical protein U0V74_07815 [Chitinophagales bacterium]